MKSQIKHKRTRKALTIIEEGKPLDEAINYALTRGIKLSREWHLYGELPSLLQIGGINFGEVVQHRMMWNFFYLFKHIELVNTKLKRHYFIEQKLPKLYRKLKNQLIKLYLSSKILGQPPGHFNLYLIKNTQNNNNNESNYKILLDTPYINFFNAVFPAIRELLGQSQNICECYVIGQESDISNKFSGVIKRLDVGSIDEKECKEKARALRTYYHSKLKKDAIFQNIFEYRGIKIWDIIKDDISLFFDTEFITLAFSTAYFQRVIDTIKPDILIVGDDRATAVRSHVLMAKKRGMPVLEIQHGIWIPMMPMDTPLSDRIAAGGDYDRKVYIKFGAKNEQMVVTGWPKFDIYAKLKESLIEKHKNGADILFALPSTSAPPSIRDVKLNFDIIETIGSFIEDSMDFRLIVKPHPSENTKIYNQIAKKYKNVILHKSSEDISSLIAYSDIPIIFQYSTLGLEAAILDKAIIYINTTNEESMYADSGIAIEVKKLDELIPAIKDVLYKREVREKLAEARKKFVYEHAYIQDGKASKRVADLIVQMIEERSGERRKER